MSITRLQLQEASWVDIGVRTPWGEPIYISAPDDLITEEVWDEHPWNQSGDPDASDKPSWPDVLTAVSFAGVGQKRKEAEYYLDETHHVRKMRTDTETLPVSGTELRLSTDGLDHTTGLLALVEQATTAGAQIPHTIFLDGDRRLAPRWTEAARREVVAAAACRENAVESAHAVVRRRYQDQADIRDDIGRSLSDREAAATAALAIAEDYETHLDAAIRAYDPDALPTDLPTLQEVLAERIEAAAMSRVREIKGAKTQQGVDVPATCLDMARALEEVSQECALGIAAVDEAADRAAAKTAYDTAVASIEAVTPLNVPEWQTETTTAPAQGHEVHIRADHPQGANIAGLVRIRSYLARDANGDPVVLEGARVIRPPISPKSHVLSGKVPAGAAYPLKLTVEARNLCGPSTLTFTVDDPSQ